MKSHVQMLIPMNTQLRRAAAVLSAGLMLILWSLMGAGCTTTSPDFRGQRVFQRPEAAATALQLAVRDADNADLHAIFGSGAEDLLNSGDALQDRHQRQVFQAAMDQGWTIDYVDNSTRELVVGDERWPFPIPLVRDSRGWWFDTVAGEKELLARRVGRNELACIGALQAFVKAQREYASTGHDGKPAGIYAQRIRSQPGRQDGLYWPVDSPSSPKSPLGEFASAAFAQGYGLSPRELQSPYQGYFFRFLFAQGANAPGGAKSYLVNGELTGGFAMIAYPAEYGRSGIVSFLVGPDGVVLEQDFGPDTLNSVNAITEFDPKQSWKPVQ